MELPPMESPRESPDPFSPVPNFDDNWLDIVDLDNNDFDSTVNEYSDIEITEAELHGMMSIKSTCLLCSLCIRWRRQRVAGT